MIGISRVLTPSRVAPSPPIEEALVVVHIDARLDRLFAVALSGRCRKPRRLSLAAVQAWVDEQVVGCATLELPEWMMRPDSAISTAARHIRDRRFHAIYPLLEQLDGFLMGTYGAKLIGARAREIRCGRESLYRWLNLFLRLGQIPNALLPEYHNCGTGSPAPESAKIGARRKDGVLGRNMLPDDIDNVVQVAKTHYVPGKMTLEQCYKLIFLPEFYSKGSTITPEGRVEPQLIDLEDRPSAHQFYHHLDKYLTREGIKPARHRLAPSEYAKDFAGRTGDAPRAEGPGHILQLDATPADIELVSRFCPTRSTLVGRATIYQTIDVFSGVTVGLYVCLGPPSWANARLAVLAAMREKDDAYFEELGIKRPPGAMPACCKPSFLFVDNGEVSARLAEGLPRDLAITVLFGRARRGDDKGHVEKENLVINGHIAHLPGYVSKDVGRQNRTDPKRGATLTLRELQEELHEVVMQRNSYRTLPGHYLTEEMIVAGAPRIPIELWEWGMRYRPWLGLQLPLETLQLWLLEVGEASITREGIKFRQCLYRCEEVRRRGLQDRKPGRNRAIKLEIRFMRHSARFILLLLPDKTTAWATLATKSERFERCSFDEVEIRLREEQAEETRNSTRDIETQAAQHTASKARIDNALKEKVSLTKGEVKSQPIREQRAEEIGHEVIAQRDAYEGAVEDVIAADTPPAAEPPPDHPAPPTVGDSALRQAMADDLDEEDDE